MRHSRQIACLLLLATGLFWGDRAAAQQVQITTPYHVINDSFYENFGFGWAPVNKMGANGGWYFSGIPANSTPPPFGGYDPAADARFGFRLGPFGFNFLAGQGSNRSHVMQAPTIVIPNGGTGYLFDGSVSPFVMGVIPVVGNAPMIPVATSPLAERLERLQHSEELLAAQAAEAAAAEAVADDPAEALRAPLAAPAQDDAPLVMRGGRVVESPAKRAESPAGATGSTADRGAAGPDDPPQSAPEAAALRHELFLLIDKGRSEEANGRRNAARLYYQQAAAQAEGELKQRLDAKIQSLGQ